MIGYVFKKMCYVIIFVFSLENVFLDCNAQKSDYHLIDGRSGFEMALYLTNSHSCLSWVAINNLWECWMRCAKTKRSL